MAFRRLVLAIGSGVVGSRLTPERSRIGSLRFPGQRDDELVRDVDVAVIVPTVARSFDAVADEDHAGRGDADVGLEADIDMNELG